MKPIKSIDFRDALIFLGLVFSGTGLFLWFNLGVSLTIIGAALLLISLFGKV